MKNQLAVLALLGLVAAGSSAQVSAGFALNDVSQSVRVTAIVNKKTRIEVLRAVQEIMVTPSDSFRGYLDIRDAVKLMVWCNSLEGVQVTARLPRGIHGPRGEPRPRGLLALETCPGGGYAAFDGGSLLIYESSGKEKATPLYCSLRLYLPPGSTPGLYRIGLAFEATPK